jgi:hypothetical protein
MKPSEGRFTCNFDASFYDNSNKVGIRMCIKEENGTLVLAKIEWFSLICEVHIGEAPRLQSALDCDHELNLRHDDFELEAKRVVDSFNFLNCDVT